MFTGIVQEVGKVQSSIKVGNLIKLGVKSLVVSKTAKISDSVSVNGVCLTLIHKDKDLLFFEAIASTLKGTNLKRLKKGSLVNLEPALSVGDKLGGHFVLGHVDSELKLRRVIPKSGYWQLEVDLPIQFKKFALDNGSLAIEGISLTIKKVFPRSFSVHIIPFTYSNTSLKKKRVGDWVNIEFDYLLKGQLSKGS